MRHGRMKTPASSEEKMARGVDGCQVMSQLGGMTDKIVFNGQEYDGVDAMPADIRKQYEDVMRLLSDSDRSELETQVQGGLGRRIVNVKTNVRTRIVVNGKEYGSVAELPPGVRSAYDRALARKGAGGGGGAPGGGPDSGSLGRVIQPIGEDRASGTLWRIGMWVAGAVLLAWWLMHKS